jgi:hypothetical protein
VSSVNEDGRIWGIVSRGDFTGIEIDRLEEENSSVGMHSLIRVDA